MEAPTFKDASLKSSLMIFLDKPFVSPFVTHVSSLKHLNVNIIEEKKNKDPKLLRACLGVQLGLMKVYPAFNLY